LRHLIDDEKLVKQGAELIKALLEAQSPRLTNEVPVLTGEQGAMLKFITYKLI
jgi:hypothetical protein